MSNGEYQMNYGVKFNLYYCHHPLTRSVVIVLAWKTEQQWMRSFTECKRAANGRL